MKKITFEGTINGETFDNVQDYNNRMQELISAGVTDIDASSKTSVKGELCNEENDNDDFNLMDYLPFFNNGNYYLDQLVSEDDSLNEKNLAYAEGIFKDTYKSLRIALEKGDVDVNDLLSLIGFIKDIRSRIAIDSNENHKAVDELTEKISNETKRLHVLNNAKPILASVSDYYDL